LGQNRSNINAEKYVKEAIEEFNVPVMICETGFDVTKPQLAHEVMIDLFSRMTTIPACKGIFYWEPEVDGKWKPASYEALGWGAYGIGAFTTDGKPTKALYAFGGRTADDRWNLWIDNEQTGIYDVKADLANMIWTHVYNPDANAGIDRLFADCNDSEQWFDLYGNIISSPVNGHLYIVKRHRSQ